MGTSGKSGGEDYNAIAGLQGYNQWSPGGQMGMGEGDEFYDAYNAGWTRRQSEADQEQRWAEMFNSIGAGSGPSYDDQMADQEKIRDEIAEKNRVIQGERDRNQYIGQYFDAANESSSYITDKIAKEKANANLMGVNYQMNDDIKKQRINQHFSSIWSEDDQVQLDTAIGDFGFGDGPAFTQDIFREGAEGGTSVAGFEDETGGGAAGKDPKLELGAASILGA